MTKPRVIKRNNAWAVAWMRPNGWYVVTPQECWGDAIQFALALRRADLNSFTNAYRTLING